MRKTLVGALGCLILAGVGFASDVDKRTAVTLNEPVMVAGVPVVTLQPGKYVLRLMNHDHNRNIVQVFNDREDRLFTTVLAIPNYKLEPPKTTEFQFWETPRGNPIALRAWFSPGDRWGQEFVYPKGLAASIARETGEPVLTARAETEAELRTAPITEVNKAGEEQPLEEAFTPPAEEVAEVEAPPEAAPAEVAAPEPAQAEPLPATGSPFFIFGLIGVLAAAAGFTLRFAVSRAS
jgi:hypothetical protein